MVLAAKPVLSAKRLAARPVGAHSATVTDFAHRILRMELTRVVLPTPGPPVTTSTLLASASATAARRQALQKLHGAAFAHARVAVNYQIFSQSLHGSGHPMDQDIFGRYSLFSKRCFEN